MESPTITFLFTDVEGSTRLWEQQPDGMRQALARHDRIIECLVSQHRGKVVRPRGEGDSRFAVFDQAVDAALAAAAIQAAFAAEAWPLAQPLQVRMALHTGQADYREGDYYGSAVNRCARLRALAHGGQALLSAATATLAGTSLPSSIGLRSLGEHRLKDLVDSEQVYQLMVPGTRQEFPPLLGDPVVRHNLPAGLTPFVGRRKDRQAIRELLAEVRLVTLVGPGGVGKTRLAIQVASDCLEDFRDGAYLVELAPVTNVEGVASAVAAPLGLREDPSQPVLQVIADAIKRRQLLLVLDNCEHVIAGAADVALNLLRTCPDLRILATSREPMLLSGESVQPVTPLAVPHLHPVPRVDEISECDAVRLFVDRAAAAAPRFNLSDENAGAVADICRGLDGIPLALELAAARVRVLGAQGIASRLNDRFRLLNIGTRGAPPRHQTLKAAIDWSYELLSEPERRLLSRLSVFSGTWDLAAVEAVATVEPLMPEQIVDLLSQLVDKSLVQVVETNSQPRYRLLESVRQYAGERLATSGEDETTRQRHLQYFANFVEDSQAHFHSPTEWERMEQIEYEHDNIRAALTHAVSTSDAESAQRLAGGMAEFWNTRGHFREGSGWLDRALSVEGSPPARTRAWALSAAGTMRWCLGDYPAANAFHQAALALFQETGDARGIGFSTYNTAVQSFLMGDIDATARLLADSERVYRTGRFRVGLAEVLNAQAALAMQAGDSDRARKLYRESLLEFRAAGDRRDMIAVLNNLGELARSLEDFSEAVGLYEQTLAMRQFSEPNMLVMALHNLGQVLLALGQDSRSLALFQEGLAICGRLGEMGHVALCTAGLAGVAVSRREWDRAAQFIGAADAMREVLDAPFEPIDEEPYRNVVSRVEQQLGQARFAAAVGAGRGLALEDVMNLASEMTSLELVSAQSAA